VGTVDILKNQAKLGEVIDLKEQQKMIWVNSEQYEASNEVEVMRLG
jgi:hypothetical protein